MNKTFVGIEKDLEAGMTPTGNIIRDAWLFGILPESETCENWTIQAIDALYDKVSDAWQPYGHLVSNLPDDLISRHKLIYDRAIAQAKQLGWDPELGEHD